MVALRRVAPRKACDPGSLAPSYASTSVSRSATSPWRSVAPSSRGATSSTGPSRAAPSSGEAVTVRVDETAELGQLLADPDRGGAAATVAGRDGAADGEHRAD